ncbi:phosphoribosylformylglycinamidine synthase [Coriobacterium glomerans PW2]|uniref:Phosphoribosylformylglycinamidine synthase n=1 Tax=Coriobacterium glomerans (strain ATCC 49209 / DSM 20642 / JCM 10262 / PW2) TaxID=700015 RepID=F2NBH9_CORGP|nr:phosphoribosylformylglycinamidine synthase [Coriobacterium glomerans]AEB06715.1 phosphoribosylformylglycinamidine synthase [Coriobacterium glomerans PW2]
MVCRIYVEKRTGLDIEAQRLGDELRATLGVPGLRRVRIVNRYDVEGISEELFRYAVTTVFSEPQVDVATRELPRAEEATVFAVEFLPGQFDQRAESASECIQLISQGERPQVRSARVYVLEGHLSAGEAAAIERYVVNPVEARPARLELPETLAAESSIPESVEMLNGFRDLDADGLDKLIAERGLAMDAADISFCQTYFRGEHRDPSITELRVIDTYWSDHCRHTTFGTQLADIEIEDDDVRDAYERYLRIRRDLGRAERPVTLMDMGTIGARHLKASGELRGVDESEEINACSVHAAVDVNGRDEDWLLLFKNETHNHPTEIEPFGGAATCIGGAIRDPLSGRSYVYQAMRVTGAADPLAPVADTLPGKLPQRKLVTAAAQGYSSYGNQIGLATGQVTEIYHPGYVAKRLEIGAVVGATPASHVHRERPCPGDKIILLGGRTGRDGIGGATGSSKTHSAESIETCGAEVQKGNAPVERKLQRLFRGERACRLIKRCNDFGAGGVAVAVGELADGLAIDLDRVTKKYEGLDGTELAISESQERMAVAVSAEDVEEFMSLARSENLEATVIAEVTDDERVRMIWRGDVIVDIARAFLASNGAPKHARARVEARRIWQPTWPGETLAERLSSLVSDLNVCSNKGLAERFDSTIGAATVLMPFGGSSQLTPAQAMVAKFPVDGETRTASAMAFGFNPFLMELDPFAGAYLSVVESISKLVASGFTRASAYLSFQEYFERLRSDPKRWGKPVSALLGALMAQIDLKVAAIGGKDSMSGSFENLDVPPTLVSFAVSTGPADRAVSPEFKAAGHRIVRIAPAAYGTDRRPAPQALLSALRIVEDMTGAASALAIATPGYGCGAEELFKMSVGNRVGVALSRDVDIDSLFEPMYGSFIVEVADTADLPQGPDDVVIEPLGTTLEAFELRGAGETIDLDELQQRWESALESVFPYRAAGEEQQGLESVERLIWHASADRARPAKRRRGRIAKPRVVIPIFPGTNCEYDSVRAFEAAGAVCDALVLGNLTPSDVAESTAELARRIRSSQIVMIPGGFSGGDEPDGSAKFITAFFRAPEVADAVRELLGERDGLMLGICNGFQALIKLGLIAHGDIVTATAQDPTLTLNTIGRHQSRLVRVRLASDLSPWVSACDSDTIYTVPVSHGEGRFEAPAEVLSELASSGQIAAQYVDEDGAPSMALDVNPNGSLMAIEAISSPDGRVLGKMGHTERRGRNLYANVPGNTWMPIFESGVSYFSA